jgi:hypothetical protein
VTQPLVAHRQTDERRPCVADQKTAHALTAHAATLLTRAESLEQQVLPRQRPGHGQRASAYQQQQIQPKDDAEKE